MPTTSPLMSIVSPVYRGEKLVHELVSKIVEHVESITDNFEIVLVEDGSPDASWDAIEKACSQEPRVKGIKLSRNFGQHAAIQAGLTHAKGEWIVVMDCDLQDRPQEIPALYQKALEGYDVVFAKRQSRQDSFLKKMSSKLFYRTLAYLTETPQNPEIANFGVYHKKVIEALVSMNDYIRYFPTMIKWVGFQSAELEVAHDSRFEGKTTYSWKKLLRLALSVILSFSDKPLRLTIKCGLAMSGTAFAAALFVFVSALLGHYTVTGWASLMISIWFLSGMNITIMGIIGLYVGSVFEQVKERPVFIVDKIENG